MSSTSANSCEPPSAPVATFSISTMSALRMPASIRPCTCFSAASVTSLADCIKASSAGDLTMRQAPTSASPETTSRPAAPVFVTRSMMKKRVVASTASGPPGPARARRAPAMRSKGLSSSFQGRTSADIFSVSRIEGSSKKGVTITTPPSAGISAAVVLSDLHQRTPVKYSSVDPASTSSAATFRCCIKDCSFAIRAACSCAVMGCAASVSELRLWLRGSDKPPRRRPARRRRSTSQGRHAW